MSATRVPGPLRGDDHTYSSQAPSGHGWLHSSLPGPVGIICTLNGDEGLPGYQPGNTERYYSLRPGVSLTAGIESVIASIASLYHAETGAKITVNSGTRTARSQAEAMYTKFAAGGEDETRLYRAQAEAKRLFSIFEQGGRAGHGRTRIIDDMQAEIDSQIAAGVYISKHLRSGAVDVRSIDMSQKQKQAFRRAASRFAESVILESHPPHWHLQFE